MEESSRRPGMYSTRSINRRELLLRTNLSTFIIRATSCKGDLISGVIEMIAKNGVSNGRVLMSSAL